MYDPMEDSQHVIAVVKPRAATAPPSSPAPEREQAVCRGSLASTAVTHPLRTPREVSASQQAPPECRSKSAPWNTLCQHHPDPLVVTRRRRSRWRAFARPLPMELHRATSVPRLTHSPAVAEGCLCERHWVALLIVITQLMPNGSMR